MRRRFAAAALLLAALAGCQHPTTQPEAGQRLDVVSVADGDTLTARTAAGDKVRVRILGIDAPEVAKDGQPAQCGADDARAALLALVDGQTVELIPDPVSDAQDRYGRLLGYVTAQGVDVGAALIDAGMAAAWYPRSAAEPSRSRSYRAAQVRAESAGAGLWNQCPTIGR